MVKDAALAVYNFVKQALEWIAGGLQDLIKLDLKGGAAALIANARIDLDVALNIFGYGVYFFLSQ